MTDWVWVTTYKTESGDEGVAYVTTKELTPQELDTFLGIDFPDEVDGDGERLVYTQTQKVPVIHDIQEYLP